MNFKERLTNQIMYFFICLLIFNNGKKKYENYVYIKMYQDNIQKYFINHEIRFTLNKTYKLWTIFGPSFYMYINICFI